MTITSKDSFGKVVIENQPGPLVIESTRSQFTKKHMAVFVHNEKVLHFSDSKAEVEVKP